MLKKINRYAIIFILILIPFNIIHALEIDVKSKGKININYIYNDEPLNDIDSHIYKIASVDKEGVYYYETEYSKLNYKLNNLTSSETNDLAIKLVEFIDENNLKYVANSTTTENGNIIIEDLSVGMYLIVSDKKIMSNYEYLVEPVLISIPIYDELSHSHSYNYDINMKIKKNSIIVDSSNQENNNMTNNNVEHSPLTYDDVLKYIFITLSSLIAIILIMIYVIIRRNEDEKKI